MTERIAKLGERHTPLERSLGPYRGTYVLERVSRGRYVVEEAKAMIDDPFGLAHSEVDLAAGGSLLVYPRLVALDRLFSESGAHAQDGRRLLLRRPSGFDLHSVREYEQGESLRKVHWRTTARRGQLMVKELEDAPRDEIAVVLDAEASRGRGGQLRRAGARGRLDPSFACSARQTRSAGRQLGLAADHPRLVARRGLVRGSRPPGGCGGGRRRVPSSSCSRATAAPRPAPLETVVVTARVSGPLATRLVQRALAGQGVSVVWIDAPSFVGRPTRIEPELLRLQAAGVAVAVVRRGDSLAAVLGAAPAARSAHA